MAKKSKLKVPGQKSPALRRSNRDQKKLGGLLRLIEHLGAEQFSPEDEADFREIQTDVCLKLFKESLFMANAGCQFPRIRLYDKVPQAADAGAMSTWECRKVLAGFGRLFQKGAEELKSYLSQMLAQHCGPHGVGIWVMASSSDKLKMGMGHLCLLKHQSGAHCWLLLREDGPVRVPLEKDRTPNQFGEGLYGKYSAESLQVFEMLRLTVAEAANPVATLLGGHSDNWSEILSNVLQDDLLLPFFNGFAKLQLDDAADDFDSLVRLMPPLVEDFIAQQATLGETFEKKLALDRRQFHEDLGGATRINGMLRNRIRDLEAELRRMKQLESQASASRRSGHQDADDVDPLTTAFDALFEG